MKYLWGCNFIPAYNLLHDLNRLEEMGTEVITVILNKEKLYEPGYIAIWKKPYDRQTEKCICTDASSLIDRRHCSAHWGDP